MKRWKLPGMILATGLALAVSAYSLPASAHSPGQGYGWGPGMMYGYGPGMMGPGMMYGYGPAWMGLQTMCGQGPGNYRPGMMYRYGPHGPGAMGPGMMYGYGPAGPWRGPRQADLDLSIDQVKINLEHWIAASQNPHIKVGNVTEKDSDTIVAEIVTTDKGGLVQRLDINRHTGFTQPAGD